MTMNMSYCRFENTEQALRECDDALMEMSVPEKELSETEARAFKRMVKLCREIADNYGDDNG